MDDRAERRRQKWKFGKETGDKVTSNLVLYGQLTALTYDVTYNANLPADTDATVTVPDKQTKTHGVALPLSDSTPTREGLHLQGLGDKPHRAPGLSAGRPVSERRRSRSAPSGKSSPTR